MVGAVVPEVLKAWGLAGRLWEQTLLTEWGELVGPQLARQTRPGKLDRKTLYIYVTHSIWLRELQVNHQTMLLSKLQKRFGADTIKSIKLLLDPDLGRRPAG